MLLHHIKGKCLQYGYLDHECIKITFKGPQNFEDMRTVNGVLYNTYHEAAVALGIADDDKYILKAINEAAAMTISNEQYRSLRRFFVTMLVESGPADPGKLWEDCKKVLSMDKIHSMEKLKYIANAKEEDLTENELDEIYKEVYLFLPRLYLSNPYTLDNF